MDVVVCGGGPAGAACARGLALAGRRVVLVDRPRTSFAVGEGLPAAAGRILRRLGVFDAFAAAGHLPAHGQASAWGSERIDVRDALRDPEGPGWHLDRERFDADLRRAAIEAGVVVRRARVVDAARVGEGFEIRLDAGDASEETIEARFVVDATGRAAAVGRRLGGAIEIDDALVAVAARFVARSADDHDGLTRIEAVPEGWWYTARLPEARRIVVCVVDPEDRSSLDALGTRAGFLARLADTRHVGPRLDGYELAEGPRGGPASSARLVPAHGGGAEGREAGWLAVGDAAAAFDPLSSQGLLTALYGGLRAGEALVRVLARQGDASEALARVDSEIARVHAIHRGQRRAAYAAERRFADQSFWRRRTGWAHSRGDVKIRE